MKVLTTKGRGSSTKYLVQDGEEVKTLPKADLPEEVYQAWRKEQAARCMRVKREALVEVKEEDIKPAKIIKEEVKQEVKKEVVDASSQTESRMLKREDAESKMTCIVCYVNEVRYLALACGHISICYECFLVNRQLSNKCPVCQAKTDYMCVHFNL